MRSALIGMVLVFAGCSGVATDPLEASFALGADSVRHALAQRFLTTISPEATTWPSDADALVTDVQVASDVGVDVASRQKDWGKALDLSGATIKADTDGSPFAMAELFVGPIDATGIDAENVTRVGHAAVPTSAKTTSTIVFEAGGREALASALLGGLDVEAGSRFTLFLRARATVALEPGGALPAGVGALTLTIPVRPAQ